MSGLAQFQLKVKLPSLNTLKAISTREEIGVEAMLSKIILMMPKTQVKNQESRKAWFEVLTR